jgi:RNA polymerase sigma-70 factor (ECF subfamily)
MDDIELLKSKPEDGIKKAMDLYMPYVYTIVRNNLKTVCDQGEIEECVSDIFIDVFKKRNVIDPERGSLKAFICVLSQKKSIDVFRKKIKKLKYESADVLYETIDLNENIEQKVMDSETSQEIADCILSMENTDREIFIRKFYFGENSGQIAERLGITTNTVDKRVSRGYIKLRTMLKGVLNYEQL